ncbi:ABC transporter permease [Perlabentimonas gracilis]|uniref:ABC transporter permease n=1 Tax=Perlabentimonas gracilis TaxID=2715279 RepID=UPI00140CEC67|nr:ABC transporter permease [Perlabentimonas gracilis]NHB67943.1 FtsX-like permease family protein [Perlabentimonas gracilis]
MLTYNLKTALKFLRKNKAFAVINLVGLSIALAVSFIIILYVVNELSYDSCHKNRKDVYRVVSYFVDFDRTQASTPYILASTLKDEYPQVRGAVNVRPLRGFAIKHNNGLIPIGNPIGTSSEVFDIFTLPIVGSIGPSGFLDDNYSICLSQSLAAKLFENGDVVGKDVVAIINNEEQTLRVTAVFKDIPKNSTFTADCFVNGFWTIAPINSTFNTDNADVNWIFEFWQTWILLEENTNPNDIESQFRDFEKKYIYDTPHVNYSLQNLSDVYLGSENIGNSGLQGNKRDIRLFALIALLILVVAAINYIILSTAVSIGRTKEIGVRKTNGARTSHLRQQLLMESTMLTLLVLPIAYYLMMLGMPYASDLFQKELLIIKGNVIYYVLVYIALTIAIGIASGLYTSTWLSRLNVLSVLKNPLASGRSKHSFQSGLIVLQLVIFCFFVSSTLIVNSQYRFSIKKNPGFHNENLLFLNIRKGNTKYQPILQDIRSVPYVKSAAGTGQALPMRGLGMISLPNAQDNDKKVTVVVLDVDYHFLETMGIELVEGRYFSEDYGSDFTSSGILNQIAVAQLGIENPIGHQVSKPYNIIGVAKDFYFQSFHTEIMPLMIVMTDDYIEQIAIKYQPETLTLLLPRLQELWEKHTPDEPFRFSLVEELTSRLYEKERKLVTTATMAALFTLIIACMGLFGLTLFIVQRRTKEIGIRKVLGSSATQIVLSFIKTNLLYVLIAVVISTPITILVMREWLNNYVERIDIGWWIFALTFAIAALVVVLTVLAHSYRAARVNPVEALRYE